MLPFVPDFPRTSFIAISPPDLDADRVGKHLSPMKHQVTASRPIRPTLAPSYSAVTVTRPLDLFGCTRFYPRHTRPRTICVHQSLYTQGFEGTVCLIIQLEA